VSRLIIIGLFLFPFHVFAKVNSAALYRVYNDGATQVESPKLEVGSSFLKDRLNVNLGFAQDVISSASSDVVSYSSRDVITDKRTEGSGTLSYNMDDGNVGWSYVRSQENDYTSDIFSFAGTRDFFEKNTTFFASFSYGEDRISTSKDPDNKHLMTHESFSLALTQVLSRLSLVQLLADIRLEQGYLSSPYRLARLHNQNSSGTVIGVPENHPLTRNRYAMTFKYNYFFTHLKLSTSSSLRLYNDNWGVKSGTLEERVSRKFTPKFELTLQGRYYKQTKADFYEDIYDSLGPFFTGNKTLANMSAYLVGLRPTYNFTDEINFYTKYEYYRINYENHTALGKLLDASDDKLLDLTAHILGVGIEGSF